MNVFALQKAIVRMRSDIRQLSFISDTGHFHNQLPPFSEIGGFNLRNVQANIMENVLEGKSDFFLKHQFTNVSKNVFGTSVVFPVTSTTVRKISDRDLSTDGAIQVFEWILSNQMQLDLHVHRQRFCLNPKEKDEKKREFQPYYVANPFLRF